MIGFSEAVKRFFLKAFDYRGRASRAEYWWVALFQALVIILPAFLLAIFLPMVVNDSLEHTPGLALSSWFLPLLGAFSVLMLVMVVPLISLFVRRLHDTGRSGWIAIIMLLQLIPVIGWPFTIVIWVFAVIPGSPDDNPYGPPPGSGWD